MIKIVPKLHAMLTGSQHANARDPRNQSGYKYEVILDSVWVAINLY